MPLSNNQAEQESGKGACEEQLHGKRHDEVPAVGHQIIWDELAREAVAVIYAEDTGECHLGNDCEGLDCKNDGNRAVTGLYDAECEVFCNMAGNEIGT